MSSSTHLPFRILLLAFFAVAGCSASDPDADPPPALTRSEGCEKTVCQLRAEDCTAKRDECIDTCLNGSVETLSLCYDICRGIDCPICSDSACAVRSFRFTVTSKREPRREGSV